MLFNTFIDDLDDGTEHTLRSLQMIPTGGSGWYLNGWAAIQKDLSKLEEWADKPSEVQQNKTWSCTWNGTTPCISVEAELTD